MTYPNFDGTLCIGVIFDWWIVACGSVLHQDRLVNGTKKVAATLLRSMSFGELTVAVASTYTSEPIEDFLGFWLKELGFQGRIDFAPYNQVLQQLLDPGSLFARNAGGINLALVRFEDWTRFRAHSWDEAAVRDGAEQLAGALRTFATRADIPTIIVATPPSPRVTDVPARVALAKELEAEIRAATVPFASLHWLDSNNLACYGIERSFDDYGDRIGHMPYLPQCNAALATAVARRIHAIKVPPPKVVALDCDNTLWHGVLGEDGPYGITLGPGMKALQKFVVAQQAAGMLVCLVSKNAENDVLEALDVRMDFPLKREHLVAWRISWAPKSKALFELAEELNLGLDSFVFLDDNPVECAEVRAACPQVLTLQVPPDDLIVDFLTHSWAFDRLKVTQEDRHRTLLYRQNVDRTRLQCQTASIGEFLDSLQLKIDIGKPADDRWARMAQLTQRTNQFNCTTVRRTEAELRQCELSGFECLSVDVSDRFGDYGLVGVMIVKPGNDALMIDTFLLSCRVLGRGVEHAMLSNLGRQALARNLTFVRVRYVATARNEPVANFLASLADDIVSTAVDGLATVYSIPAKVAAVLTYRPATDASDQLRLARSGGAKLEVAVESTQLRDKSAVYSRFATELCRPEAVIRAAYAARLVARELQTPLVEACTAVQRELVAIWSRILRIDRVGIRDTFEDLGGTSIQAAQVFGQISTQFGVSLPMSAILDAPDIEQLAERIAMASRGGLRQSLKRLKSGREGGPTLFLVHDGDGETLLYLNLARRLPDDVIVFGIEPHGNDRCPMLHTTIPRMAAHYVEQARSECPTGPYFFGGLCAGGTIAFEMAMQLRAVNQQVGFVALFDAANVRHAPTKPFFATRRRWQHFRSTLPRGERTSAQSGDVSTSVGNQGSRFRLRQLYSIGAAAIGKLRNLAAFEFGLLVRRLNDRARIRALRSAIERNIDLPADFVGPRVRTIYSIAERQYSPQGRLDAPVLLFRAGADGCIDPSDEPLIEVYGQTCFGWDRWVVGGAAGIETIDVAGGHGGILQEPNVETISQRLRASLQPAVVGGACG